MSSNNMSSNNMSSTDTSAAGTAPAAGAGASRNARIQWLSGLACLLLLVVLLFANAILARASVRIDLTEEGIYTLSDGSKSILNSIEDPARIKVFWHRVPLTFAHTKRYVAALLEEMETASNGKVQAQWIDMSEDAGVAQASELGLEEHTFRVRHGSELRRDTGYMSLVVEMGDAQPEKINALANVQDQLEYRIVSSIFKGQRAAPSVVAFIQRLPNPMGGQRQQSRFAHLEYQLFQTLGRALRQRVTLDRPIPADVDVVILADPRDLTPQQVFRFEQFLLRGGRAIVMLDPLDRVGVLSPQVDVVRSASSGMEDWLAHVGVTVEKGCVVDFHEAASCFYPYEIRDRQGRTLGQDLRRYTHWLKVLPANVDPTNPVMRYLKPMAMYWPAAVSVDQEKQQAEGRKATVLATTSEQGHRRADVTNLRQPGFSSDGKLLEKVPLIVLVEGPLTSFWADKPDPTAPPPKAPEVPVPPDDADPKDADPKGDAPKDGQGAEPKGAFGSPDGDDPAPKDAAPKAPKKDEPKKDDAGGDGGDGGDGQDAGGPASPDGRLTQGSLRLVVLGDADLGTTSFGPAGQLALWNGAGGFPFVQNMADWLSGSEELMALRSRATNPRNLTQLEEKDRDLISYLNLLLVPLLVLLAGMTVFIVRRS